MMYTFTILAICLSLVSAQTSDQDILDVTLEIWNEAELAGSFFSDTECTYNTAATGTDPLFTFVDATKLASGTYGLHNALLDNYETTTGTADTCDATCDQERSDYLDAMIATPAMVKAQEFLTVRNGSMSDDAFWKQYLFNIWFSPYSRSSGAAIDSSGFEHIFLGEIDGGEAKGYHGWLKAYADEGTGAFDFEGLIDGAVCQPDTPKFQMDFVVDGTSYRKDITSMMLKVPPEVEISFFTICKFTRSNSVCEVTVGAGVFQNIQTYNNECPSEPTYDCVGSAYFVC